MAKNSNYNERGGEELAKMVADKREELRALRFNVAGSKTRNVKAVRNLRKSLARALTAVNAKQHGK